MICSLGLWITSYVMFHDMKYVYYGILSRYIEIYIILCKSESVWYNTKNTTVPDIPNDKTIIIDYNFTLCIMTFKRELLDEFGIQSHIGIS